MITQLKIVALLKSGDTWWLTWCCKCQKYLDKAKVHFLHYTQTSFKNISVIFNTFISEIMPPLFFCSFFRFYLHCSCFDLFLFLASGICIYFIIGNWQWLTATWDVFWNFKDALSTNSSNICNFSYVISISPKLNDVSCIATFSFFHSEGWGFRGLLPVNYWNLCSSYIWAMCCMWWAQNPKRTMFLQKDIYRFPHFQKVRKSKISVIAQKLVKFLSSRLVRIWFLMLLRLILKFLTSFGHEELFNRITN